MNDVLGEARCLVCLFVFLSSFVVHYYRVAMPFPLYCFHRLFLVLNKSSTLSVRRSELFCAHLSRNVIKMLYSDFKSQVILQRSAYRRLQRDHECETRVYSLLSPPFCLSWGSTGF